MSKLSPRQDVITLQNGQKFLVTITEIEEA